MAKLPKQTIKKMVSWTIGIPAAIIAASEINDLNYWWLPFMALGVIVIILKWNHAFDESQIN